MVSQLHSFLLRCAFCVAAVCVGSALTLAAESKVSAKKDGVNVTAEPSKDSSVIVTLKKGDVVDAVERKGMFWKVKASGKDGYVSVLAVERQSGEASSIAKKIQSAATEGREAEDAAGAQRARSAVMGVRGLDETHEAAAAGNVRPNLRMVYVMEDRVVAPAKIKELENTIQREIEYRMSRKEESQSN
jgi:hypothetical protein